jgi:alkylation response protein AidB-like acyl-CoA dehydrogenase
MKAEGGKMKADWVERAGEVAAEVLGRHADEVDREGRWPAESLAALAEAGLLGLVVPEEFGGAGAGPRTVAGVVRALAEGCASTAMIYMMHVCGVQVIAQASSFPLREQVLRDAAAGRHLSTLAFSEKGSRSHFWAPVSQAVDEGETHRLSAEKSWVTSAGHAQSYIVSTRGASGTEMTASTLYYVPGDAAHTGRMPGMEVSGGWSGMGLRGNASAPMRLREVRVPAPWRLSGESEGFGVMLSTVLPWFQLCSAAVSLGIADAAVAATGGHLLRSRLEHLDESLASLMNLRARLARMQIGADTQRAFLDHVARQMENPGPATMLAVLESKAAASEMALEVTDLAMRTCGGAAFSRHLGVERHFRDARAGSVMAPTTDVLHDFIGKALLDMPLF